MFFPGALSRTHRPSRWTAGATASLLALLVAAAPLAAQRTDLRDGFSVGAGARFQAVIDPGLLP
jgi:hypothetical protein